MTDEPKQTIDFRPIFKRLTEFAHVTPVVSIGGGVQQEQIRKGRGIDLVYLATDGKKLGFQSSVAAFEFLGGEFTSMRYEVNDIYFRDHFIFMREAGNETLGKLADHVLALRPENGWRSQNYNRIITEKDITDIFMHHGWQS